MTLNEIPVGGVCTVTKLNGTGKLRRRIMDMGITAMNFPSAKAKRKASKYSKEK